MSGLLRTGKIDVAGLPIRHAILGAGAPVVLLHGFPETLQAWYAVAPAVARERRVHAFDWPGFAGSRRAVLPDPSPAGFAGFLVRLLDALEIERAALVGTDIGMLSALLVGLDHPERVERVVVTDGQAFDRPAYLSWELHALKRRGAGELLAYPAPRLALRFTFWRGRVGRARIPPEVYAEFRTMARDPVAARTGLRFFRSFRPHLAAFERRAGELGVPLLIVWGGRDVFISPRMGQELHDRVPGSRLEVIEGAGHFPHLERPEEVARLIAAFLAA